MSNPSNSPFGPVLDAVKGIVAEWTDESLLQVCQALADGIPHYGWVGFYLVVPGEKRLALGPYVGKPTQHTHIPFGVGVCGQVAESQAPRTVQDVSAEGNYLSCSIDVRSEIVFPVLKDGEMIAELDIDSDHLAPFTDEDQQFLKNVCELISQKLKTTLDFK